MHILEPCLNLQLQNNSSLSITHPLYPNMSNENLLTDLHINPISETASVLHEQLRLPPTTIQVLYNHYNQPTSDITSHWCLNLIQTAYQVIQLEDLH